MNRTVMIPIVLTLAFAGILIFWTIPIYQNISGVRAEIVEAQQELANMQNLVSLLEEFENQFGPLEKDIEKLSGIIAKEEELPELLVTLPLLVGQSGLVLNSINFGNVEPQGGYQALPVKLGVSGSYVNIQKFLLLVEQNLRILDAVSLQFGPSKTADVYDLSLALKTYFK